MWESPTHWPPGSGRPLRRSSPPTHRSAGSSDEDLRSASAIVTAAEPIWATFPARASTKVGVEQRIATHPRRRKQGAGPAGGDGNGVDRAPRCARFRPGASARLPVRDAPAADDEQASTRRLVAPASAQEQRRRADQSYPCEAGVGRTAPPRPREQWAAGRAARRRLSLSWRSGGLHLAFGARPLRSSPPLCRRLPDTCVSSREVDPRRPRRPVPSCIARAFESGRKSWRRAP
jgi:hypothetical protein